MSNGVEFTPQERREAAIWRAAESLYIAAFGDHGTELRRASLEEQRRYVLMAVRAVDAYERTADGDTHRNLLHEALSASERYRAAIRDADRTLGDRANARWAYNRVGRMAEVTR